MNIIEPITACSWCTFDLQASCGITAADGNDWTLVRAIGPSHNKWFPQTDRLYGTAAPLDNNVDTYNIGSFSATVPGYNQFLFITGDCSTYFTLR